MREIKVDSSMDRHTAIAARDDGKTSKVANPNHTKQAEGFLMRKQGCEAFCAEISLEWLSHKQKASSLLYRKKTTREGA